MVESDEEQLEVLKNWWKENGTINCYCHSVGFFGFLDFKHGMKKLRTLVKMRQRFINRFLIKCAEYKEKDQAFLIEWEIKRRVWE